MEDAHASQSKIPYGEVVAGRTLRDRLAVGEKGGGGALKHQCEKRGNVRTHNPESIPPYLGVHGS
jgi:hypothetical protein